MSKHQKFHVWIYIGALIELSFPHSFKNLVSCFWYVHVANATLRASNVK